jgi:tRNA-2-methylthio-N6-dimethylallyladenosine synthase
MRVYLETFGCQMNELDSELVRGQLHALGYQFVEEDGDAQVILYNTCSVRELAEQKALSRVGIVGQRKKAGERIILGVLGCMAERDGADLFRRHPQVDLLCGPAELDKLPQLIDNVRRAGEAELAESTPRRTAARAVALAGNSSRRSATLSAATDGLESLDLSRAFDPGAREQPWSAYVRITRGCNKFCTYCVVPYTRGAEVHRPPDHIVDECKRLADSGALEITLLGQTVNHYRYTHGAALTVDGREAPQVGPGLQAFRAPPGAAGAVRGGTTTTTTFADLLFRIHEAVPSVRRLRFVTSYPRDFGPDVLAVMRDCPRICRYLHAPAQSGSDAVLARMNRGYTVGEYEEFVAGVFEVLPDATLAGDIIVGFPGETDADFEGTCSLVRRLPFKNNFIFKYSPRPGTVAIDRFADDVPDEVKRLRNNTLLAIQGETSARVHAAWVGRTVEVLVESIRARPRARGAEPAGTVGLTVGGRAAASEAADSGARQLVGRTAGDLIVAVDLASEPLGSATDPQPGTVCRVAVTGSQALLLTGRIDT